MTAMVRAQSWRGYRKLVTDLGGTPTRLLARSGIDPAALDQLSAFIRFESHQRRRDTRFDRRSHDRRFGSHRYRIPHG
jgi:hypothetical protein